MNMTFSVFGLIIFVPLILMLAGGLVFLIVFLIKKSRNQKNNDSMASSAHECSCTSAEQKKEDTTLKQECVKEENYMGSNLRKCRIRCNMTQEFVAEAVGVSRQAVSKWESGQSDPSTSNLLALAKLYGVPAEELLKK